MATTRRALPAKPRLIWAAVSAALLPWCYANPASADVAANTLPTGGTVVAGSASISRSGSNMEITQSSNSAILNWQTFSIGSNAWVNFIQPSSSAIALNHVLGNKGSEIFGRLTANGQVFLSNPNGVLFAPGASVDVGGLFATTLSIADKDFLAGRYNFYNAGGAGSVINQGNIVTANGYTALAGPQVRNDGIIVARAGTVALAAGDRVSLDMVGDGLIKVSVDQSALNASVINSGRIEADGGNVFLTARSANALLDTVVNNSGVIRANSLVARNGEIVLDGGSAGLVANTGTISVSGVDSGTTGGTVKILGDRVALLPGTQIDASGDSGGGTVLVGGNFHGSGPEQNASVTSVASGARINADAVNSGNGGRVVVWSNGDTLFAGTITARGGALSGNGGFIETSGRHLTIGHGAYVNASAAHGARGKWLLDPTDVDITDATAINTALGGGTDTVVTTDGNITVDDLVAWAGAATLTLTAGNDVIVNQTITGTGAGANVVLIADNDGTHSGTVVTNAAVSADNITIRYNPLGNDYSSPTVFNATAASVLDAKMWVFVTAENKVYDATDVANLSLFGNAVANGALLTLGTGTFDTKNVGTGKTVTYNSQSLATGGAAFELFASAGTTAADVTPAPLSINAVTDTKVYDATISSGGAPTVSGLLGGDAVSGATQAYASKNVLGTSGSTLQVTAYTVNDGNSGNNYTVTTNSAAGTITPALLTLNAVTDSKAYDATTTSSAMPTVSGLQGADSVSGRVQAYASKNVLGPNGSTLQVTAYTVNDGNSGNNYTVSASTAAGTITPASLTINAVTDTKVYDATTSSTGVPTVGGLQGADTVSGRAQAYASKNVLGTNGSTLQVTGYTVNDGNSGNNYTVTLSTTVGTIAPASLTINAVTDTKVYDATTSSGGAPTVSGLLGGDALSGATQAYASKNVLGAGGSTLQVTGYTVNDGNSGNNYTISTSTAAGTITPASLTINAVSDTKVYDATTSSTSLPSVGGLQGADTVSGQAQAYASKNVLGTNGSTLQVTGYTVNDGNLGNNYAVTTNTAAGTITPKALTAVSLTGTISKTYDGNASATLTPSNYTISGFVAGEGATVTNTVGSYGNGKDVQGPGASVTSAVLTAGDYSAAPGTLLSNYDLSAVTGVAATGNIGQITRLASVSAISNGLWSSASTWQGGAIPDKANVANVNLNGFAVTFDNSVGTNAGVTNLDSLTGGIAGSRLTFSSSNQLQVLNALNVQGYAQTAGTVATGTTFSVTNNFNQTGGTINSGAAVNITQASGGLNAFSIAGSGTLTLTANNATGDIVLGSGAGLSGTTVTLAAGRNVSLNAPVSGSTAINVSFGQQVAGTFTPTATISGTTTVTGGAGADTFDLSGAPSITATLAGGAGSDTLRQSGGKTWTLNNATANAGSSGGLTWSAIENLTDTGAGAFNMGTGGSLSGTISAASGSINYASHAGSVTFNLNGGASTGMASWNGIANVAGSTGNDAITGMSQTYTITGANAGNNGTVAWTSFENLTDLGTGTLRATTATWTLNGSNTGTVTNLSGTFAGMGNLTDLGTGRFNMHGTADGSITGNLNGGTNGALSYAGYGTSVTVNLSGAAGLTFGVGGTRSGITFVTGSSNDDTITGADATYNLTGQNSGSSGGLGWASFENITDATGGSFLLFVQNRNVTGTLSSGNLTSSTTLTSASEITALGINVPGTLALIGTAPHWTFNGPPDAVPHLETNNPQTNVTYNSACIGGPACNTVIAIIGSINASVSQIAAQALKDAQATDSVAKQIDYGFAGDVGTTPPMDHRIDETGISTPDCFDESREGQACKGS